MNSNFKITVNLNNKNNLCLEETILENEDYEKYLENKFTEEKISLNIYEEILPLLKELEINILKNKIFN